MSTEPLPLIDAAGGGSPGPRITLTPAAADSTLRKDCGYRDMGHLLIGYYFLVISIGFAALVISAVRAIRSGESYLKLFCLLYAAFTLFLLTSMLRKYAYLNIAGFPPLTGFYLLGIQSSLNFETVLALVVFLHELYAVRGRGILAAVFTALTIGANVLLFSSGGVVFLEESRAIMLQPGFQTAAIASAGCFTYAIFMGFALLKRAGRIGRLPFAVSLLGFASIGYVETLSGTIRGIIQPLYPIADSDSGLLFSSIPYALYGLFLIVYFSRREPAAAVPALEPSMAFRTRFGITDRENDIIIRIVRGYSNAGIADELFISLSTVKSHIHNIFGKTGVKGRFGLIHKIRQERQ